MTLNALTPTPTPGSRLHLRHYRLQPPKSNLQQDNNLELLLTRLNLWLCPWTRLKTALNELLRQTSKLGVPPGTFLSLLTTPVNRLPQTLTLLRETPFRKRPISANSVLLHTEWLKIPPLLAKVVPTSWNCAPKKHTRRSNVYPRGPLQNPLKTGPQLMSLKKVLAFNSSETTLAQADPLVFTTFVTISMSNYTFLPGATRPPLQPNATLDLSACGIILSTTLR